MIYFRLMEYARRIRRLLNATRDLEAVLDLKDQEVAMWQKIALEANRSVRDVAVAFRLGLETPEIDLREDVDALIRSMDDHIANMEEQIV